MIAQSFGAIFFNNWGLSIKLPPCRSIHHRFAAKNSNALRMIDALEIELVG
jgi:hypothetical protein